MVTEVKPLLVYILGTGHCGSTLLSFLLNGNPDVVALSEVVKIEAALSRQAPLFQEEEWRRIRELYEKRTGKSFDELDLRPPPLASLLTSGRRAAQRWARPRAALVSGAATATGCRVVVDASKSWQQLLLLQMSGLFDLKVIHLVRDGRAVVASYRRKSGGLWTGVLRWLGTSMVAPVLRTRFTGASWLELSYEALASHPEPSLRRVCRFLGCDYGHQMLNYRQHRWIGIGGNRMSRRSDEEITLDDSWRDAFSLLDRLAVELATWPVNRHYGYRLRPTRSIEP